jgi:hypothetical protein
MADTDSAVVDATPTEDSPISSQMGDGLFEDVGQPAASNSRDTSQDVPDDDARHSEDAPNNSPNNSQKFDPSKIDFTRVDINEVPENYRGLVATAQNAIRSAQSGFTQRQQELQNELKQLREQVNSKGVSEAVANTIRDLNKQDEYAYLTPEQKQAIETVKEIVGTEIKELRDLPNTITEMRQTLLALQQQQQQAQQSMLLQEVNEARSLYGGDIDNYGQQIYALMQTANPKTGSRYSVREAYELVSGAAVRKAQEQQTANGAMRKTAKQAVGGPSAGATVPNGDSALSDADVIAQLKNLGFE